jgi:hypothetical protein
VKPLHELDPPVAPAPLDEDPDAKVDSSRSILSEPH